MSTRRTTPERRPAAARVGARVRGRARVTGVGGAFLALVLAGCAGEGEPDAAPQDSPPASGSASSSASAPSSEGTDGPGDSAPTEPTTPAETAPALPPAPHELSLPTLMAEEFVGGPIEQLGVRDAPGPYRELAVAFDSSGVRVSGVLAVPEGAGPFPAVVLNHGYIEPSVYVTGQGLTRERDRLVRAGFVVLHVDYRGHAASDDTSDFDRESRLGYTRDAINAVRSLEREDYVDPERIAMLGRSMGGAVTYNALVAQPGLVDAAVVFAPVSSLFVENYEQFTVPGRSGVASRLVESFGSPEEEPERWAGLSARTYADRITEPVLIHHGTADDTCPPIWSEQTQAAFVAAGVDSELITYDGEGHAFGPQFEDSMATTIAFLREELEIAAG